MPATSPPLHSNCWAEIDLNALEQNLRLLQMRSPQVMGVVKADAYGHSVDLIAPALRELGVVHFGVATASEGARLRALPGFEEAFLYVMTASAPADADLIVQNDLISFVSSARQLQSIEDAARAAKTQASVHLEIDTGIGRAGILPEQFEGVLNAALAMKNSALTGVCTHFTWGENSDDAHAQHQIFEAVLAAIPTDLRSRLLIHASNSPGMLNVPHARYGMVRPGLLLYGIAPVAQALPEPWYRHEMRPVLSLYARIILIRDLPRGATISYGRTYTLGHPARIATIGIGYGDGYSRQNSNRGHVLLEDGTHAPIRGRVCMDQLCVELPPNSKANEGDRVTLVGCSGGSEIRAVDLAESIGSAPHEITTCLTQRVPRVVSIHR